MVELLFLVLLAALVLMPLVAIVQAIDARAHHAATMTAVMDRLSLANAEWRERQAAERNATEREQEWLHRLDRYE